MDTPTTGPTDDTTVPWWESPGFITFSTIMAIICVGLNSRIIDEFLRPLYLQGGYMFNNLKWKGGKKYYYYAIVFLLLGLMPWTAFGGYGGFVDLGMDMVSLVGGIATLAHARANAPGG